MIFSYFFFFSSRRRHTRSLCDWSSDVCSSDLGVDRRLATRWASPGRPVHEALGRPAQGGARRDAHGLPALRPLPAPLALAVILRLRCSTHSSRVEPRRPYVPSIGEATHPRCSSEGCPDGPGRASSKEGESWAIIAKRSWVWIPRSCVMQLRLRMAVGRGRCGFSERSRTPELRRRNWCASSPPNMGG